MTLPQRARTVLKEEQKVKKRIWETMCSLCPLLPWTLVMRRRLGTGRTETTPIQRLA